MSTNHTPMLCQLGADDKTLVFFSTLARPVKCYSEERAAFLVKAANNHDALVAALKIAAAYLHFVDGGNENTQKQLFKFNELLAAVEGK